MITGMFILKFLFNLLLILLKIVFFVLLVLVLFLLCIIFVPIHYESRGNYSKSDREKIEINVSWLLSLFQVKLVEERTGFRFAIFLFHLPVYHYPVNKAKNKAEQSETEKKVVQKKSPERKKKLKQRRNRTLHEEEPDDAAQKDTKQKNWFERWKDRFVAFRSRWKNIENIVKEIKEFITNQEHQRAFRHLKRQILWFIRKMLPSKFHLFLHFGFQDPALTADVAGLFLVFLYPIFPNQIELVPDIENIVLEFRYFIKGKVRVFIAFHLLLRLWMERSFRTTVKRLWTRVRMANQA
ncbi:hypothetical protein FACS189418_0130 [Clostridia bacterium]|nr:hypothetical protein FACS189418_0130 [Clostridia bacterium]